MKTLLINPPARIAFNPEMTISYPIGLAYLAGNLLYNGFDVKIFDFVKEENWKSIKSRIKKYAPDVVGIKCDTNSRVNAFRIARIVKNIDPNVKVIFGGPHSSIQYNQVLQDKNVDIISIGESEISIVETIKTITKDRDISKISGIVYKKNGKIIKTKPRPFIKDLDTLPMPAYELLDFKQYKDARNKYNFHIMTSRGCPFSCNFCDVPVIWGSRFRQHNVKKIISEINILNSYAKKFRLYFLDDFLDIRSKRNTELFRSLIDERLDFNWTMRTRVECVDRKSLMLAKKSGLHKISFGLESGSQIILDNINKGITQQQIIDAFRKTKKAKIVSTSSVIIGNPGETESTMDETRRLLKKIKPDYIYSTPALIFPGTALERLAITQGLFKKEYWLGNGFAPIYLGAMNKTQIIHYCRTIGRSYPFIDFIYNKLIASLNYLSK